MRSLDKKAIEDMLSLTPTQEGMLYHYLKDPDGSQYVDQLCLEISGTLDLDRFERAINHVTASNEMLRTFFRWEMVKNPVQIILREHTLKVIYHDLSCLASREKVEQLEEIKAKDRQRKFDLREVPFRVTLCQLEQEKYEFLISNHHILYDGWSSGIILEELFTAYDALSRGDRLVKPVKTRYKEFIQQVRDGDTDRQRAFWQEYLAGLDSSTEISIKGIKKEDLKEADRFRVTIAADAGARFEAFAREQRITLAAFFYTAWGILLQKYNNCDDVLFGTTVSGRSVKISGVEEIVGLFINTLPLRVTSSGSEKSADLLFKTNRILQTREEYELTPLVDIKGYSELGPQEELFDSIVVIENYPLDRGLSRQDSELRLTAYSMNEASHYDVTLVISTFNGLEVNFIYNRRLFSAEQVERMSLHFLSLLKRAAKNPAQEIGRIEIISTQEKRRILQHFNDTTMGYPENQTIHQLFEQQAAAAPDSTALVGSGAGAKGTAQYRLFLTYGALNEQSSLFAHLLRDKGVTPNHLVAVLAERSLETVAALMGILKSGGAYLPIDPEYPQERIDYILEDSGSRILVVGQPQALPLRSDNIGAGLAPALDLDIIPISQSLGRGESTYSPEHTLSATSLAYLLYTSGSTGRPKGVMVEHRSVVNILLALQEKYPLKREGTYLFKTSYLFDVSVTELFGWFLAGGRLAVLETGGEKEPAKILTAVESARVTHINFVPSMFNVFVDALNPENIDRLSSLKYIFLAGEALVPELVKKFRRLHTKIVLENIYGPTEGTVYASGYSLCHWQGEGNIPIGTPLCNIRLHILDKDGHLQPIGIAGELCIGGAGLASGYLNKPALTVEKFITAPAFSPQPQPATSAPNIPLFQHSNIPTAERSEARLYRTGDLARWLPDGNIEFLGRIDHQVKVRGFRIELAEIESQLLNHDAVKEAVVMAREDARGDNYLCAYVVKKAIRQQGNSSELREFLSAKLPNYMIPAYFVEMEEIPLTSSGKAARQALPVPRAVDAAVGYTAPRDELERKLVETWSGILGIERDKIGIDANFFETGGHSLKAVQLASRLHKEFDVVVQLSEIFEMPTIRALSVHIKAAVKEKFLAIDPAAKKEYYPLTSAQRRFFIFQELEVDDVSYNMNEMFVMEGKLDKEKLEETFKKLIQRHESLRTSFELIDGEPVQRIHEEVVFKIEYLHLETLANHDWLLVDQRRRSDQECWDATPPLPQEFEDLLENFICPFDLSWPPLMRAALIGMEEEKYILMFDMHHIISDGVSTGIFIRDFLSLYSGEELAPLRIQYRDYAQWLYERRKRADFGGREIGTGPGDYEGELLELPTDYVRPPIQSFAGNTVKFEIGSERTAALYELALKEDATFYMVMLAAVNIFLAKLSGQESVVIGSPIAGRLHDDLQDIIGLFINTLVIRNFPSAEKSFLGFLKEVKENSLQAFENQQYQYEELVEKIEITRGSGRNPLFDVMFVLQNMEVPEIEIPGLQGLHQIQVNRTSKFDMTLYCEERGEALLFDLEYCTKLFKQETIRRYVRYFKKAIADILENPEQKISDIEIISKEEKGEILYDFNDTVVEYARDTTIYRLFEEQVERTAGNIAVAQGKEGDLTYRQLNERANRLARVLRARGVKANSVVGIMLERSSELIEGIYAVLKAGGAYLSLDPEYPEKRILSMLEQSKAQMLLTTGEILEQKNLPEIGQQTVMVDELAGLISSQPADNLEPLSRPDDLIYIIFTSGSTGVPKGAGVYQRSFVNLVNWFVKDFALKADDSNLLMTSFSFDLTQKNFYASLILGGILCIPPVNYFDPAEILRELEERRITWINCTPSMFFQLIEFCKGDELKRMESLRYVYLGGEPISMKMFMKWLESEYCRGEIVNTYGPTECTDISNSYRVKEPSRFLEEAVPIGKPVYNVRLYVCDRNLQLLPVGIAGELLIAGESVGIGYVNDRELTKKKFVRHSFVKGESEQLLYRTGDLVKWLPDGNIVFIGRMDYQVKVRGFRIEIGEIESQLLNHEEIKEAVVLALDSKKGASGQGDKFLCAYIVLEEGIERRSPGLHTPAASQPPLSRGEQEIPSPGGVPEGRGGLGFSHSDLREYLSQSLPDYMIPAHFVEMKELPLNPNGKVNRKALPVPEIVSEQEYTAPRNGLEEKLAEIWSRILGIEKEKIGIDDNFFALGGHSLKAAELIAAIHQRLNAEIALKELFRIATIRGLSESISRGEKSRYVAIEPVEEKEYYALSSAQKRLYLLRQMDLESTSYNIPSIFMVAGALDREQLQETFWKLIQRHESLRTSFHMIKDEPVQKIHKPDDIEFEIEYYEVNRRGGPMWPPGHTPSRLRRATPLKRGISGIPSLGGVPEGRGGSDLAASIIESFIRSFDLTQAPLLRVGLIKQEKEKHLLMLDMHHIISDGISSDLFVRDFMALYNGERLHELKIQYKDFSTWQNERKESEALIPQEQYWIEAFVDEIPVINLPTDFPRPTVQGFAGKSQLFEIAAEQLEQLKALALETNTTLFMVLLSLFNLFLARICVQEDIVVGSPVSGRTHGDLEQVIGIFINTLALRNYPIGERRFNEFLLELSDRTLAAFDNQEYQFEDLVERVEVSRDAGRNPLFDVLFVLQNMETPGIEIPGLKLKSYEYEGKTAKFDLTFNAIERTGGLYITVSYRTDLFLESTVQRFIAYFKTIMGSVLNDPGQKLHEIEMLSEQERTRLLIDFNDTEVNYSHDKTIQGLFEEQAERGPDTIALIGQCPTRSGSFVTLSYRQLNREANRLARRLRDRGIMQDTISGILTEPSLEMIIGILAVIKAGGAYLPLDPRHPIERISYMLADSCAKLLLSQGALAERVGFDGGLIDISNRALYEGDSSSLESGSGSGSVIYAIYTSGTTGKSKGALITHANLVNYVEWFVKKANVSGGDRSALTSSFAFDLGYTAIFSSLLAGCQLHVVGEEVYLSPGDLIAYIEKNRISYLKMTPSLFAAIVDSPLFSKGKCHSLRLVVLGGEEIKTGDVKRAHEMVERLEVMNHYGPTEATIGCIAQFIDFDMFEAYSEKPTIGQPIHNTGVFILDRNMSLLPEGVVGELWVSGDGLVRGYLNRAELTGERFVESPYRPGTRLYRTGDLACRLADGTTAFVGRSDNQVKIRGFRIETGEIESRLSEHVDVKEAAVLVREDEQGDRYLCAYVVAAEGAGELKKYLSQVLPGYMVPSYFVELASMPLTANGKVDRRRLPVPETGVSGGEEYAAPGDSVETELAQLWSEVLGIEKIGIDDNFFLLGGHSLKAIMIGSRIQKAFGVKIALAEIFSSPTIRGIAAHIKNRQADAYSPPAAIEPAEEKEYYALSSAQKRLYIIQQMDEESIGYNTPRTHLLAGKIDRERLEHTFKKLIERHESFRTSFHEVEDEHRQKIHNPADIEFEIEEFTGVLRAPDAFFRPFDLAKAPLIRVGLMPICDFDISSREGNSKEEQMLMLDMHHIITDGISTGIFIREFMAIYSGDELAPPRIQYKDYSEWQNRNRQSESIIKQEAYWLDQFKGELPVLDLPTDYHGSAEMSFAGASIAFEIGQQETGALNELAKEEGATLFMVLLALYNILLSKLGCCEDVVIGMPIMGRKQPELQHTIGMFVNTLALRNYPAGEKTFKEFLKEIKERTLDALENQDYQFEDLVEKVESTLDRKSHRNPLFDVMFVLQNLDIPVVEIPGLTLTPYEYQSKTAKFDLTLAAEERGERLLFTFEYSSELFTKETIERFSGYYQDLAVLVLSDRDIKINDIDISTGLSDSEQVKYSEASGEFGF